MNQKYFKVQEAEDLIPELEKRLREIRDMKTRLEHRILQWRENADEAPAEEALKKSRIDFLVSEINGALARINTLGCFVKDIDLGLVDFPGRLNGKEGYLCWKSGESKIGFWHGLTEGYSGRKPLKKIQTGRPT